MSLLGYFWLFIGLNCLDALVTVTGIEMGILYERNLIVNFFLESYGLNGGMFIVKAGVLILAATIFKLHVPGTNVVRNAFIALILLYSAGIAHMTWTICQAAVI